MRKVIIIGRDDIPRKIELQEGMALDLTLLALPGTSAVVDMEIDLAGAGASLDLSGLYICPGDERLDFKIKVSHLSGACESRQVFRGIVGGTARASFHGLVYVAKNAGQTKAYQENHNLQLSGKAVVETSPQLEIYADDVECSHGATVGRLDEQEQFYMRSRGIPEDAARELQMISFVNPIVEGIEDETLINQIYDSLSKC